MIDFSHTVDRRRAFARLFSRSESTGRIDIVSLRTRYLDTVYGFVVRRIPAGVDADDIVAETFLAALARIDRCPEPGPDGADFARAWLLGIARHKLADAIRHVSRRRETPSETSERADERTTRGPEVDTLAGAQTAALRDAIRSLKPEYADALLLKYVDELSLAEMAIVLGKRATAVSSLLQRARAAAVTELIRRQIELADFATIHGDS